MSEFDRSASSYGQVVGQAVAFSGQEHAFFLRVKADILAGMLARQGLAGRATMLDVGCGVGLMDAMLGPHCGSLTGVDVSSASLDMARTNCPDGDFRHYDGQRLPFPEQTFDLTFTVCVMHHVPPADWPGFVREMARVTRPGGLVVVMEHNPYNPLTRYVVSRVPFDKDAVLLRPGRTRALLREACLERLEVRHFLFTPLGHALARRFDNLLAWLPLGAQYLACGRVPASGATGAK
ncbi:2-methyl-6-phytyl-1,4-hydroquinone methyltransferase [Fundidesulfovibrio magnetotacticus]|uniref:2-methyl-6-phytyl-1,4-hydroquinone methyltransferase n=1 Tax=Fundidesulfovibrio magnetotacticus TaxID=2730080 RepID=A0A6V8LQV1_9BACT|nr:class I SAM-dependent methyltransferase [Fundidesulfovibrio magnetotacticus]GFK92718.1 2-methyl-6-phytyl-1,4-hydroquinone methyltransferase [Fundidesulfovibrio magnetotacticus]